jgi:translation initiation factor 1
MDWKDMLGALYEAAPETEKQQVSAQEATVKPLKQQLCLQFQRRGGKPAVLITGFEGTDEQLKELCKLIKTQLGVGGSARGGEILIQGDVREKLRTLLKQQGHQVKGN